MDDYFDAYLEQFTNGCGCPTCRHNECFSSPYFKYKDYDSTQLAQVAEKVSKTSSHLCDKLSPMIVNPSIFEDLVIFSDFVNSVISNDPKTDFSIFEKIIKSPQIFYMLFLDSEDMDYYNFSFDEDLLVSFLNQIRNVKKFRNYMNDLISLASTIFRHVSIDSPHIMRATLLITLFLSIFDVHKVTAISNFFDSHRKIDDQFYTNLIKYRKLAEIHIAFWQKLITHACQNQLKPGNVLDDSEIIGMVSHIQKISNINRKNGFPINSNLFKNEEVSSILDRESEIHSLLLSRPTLLDFPSFIAITFKREIQERISSLIMFARNDGRPSYLVLEIDRNNIVRETMKLLTGKKQEDLQKPLKIIFKNEKGDDSGGLSREYFHLITKELFCPDFPYFELVNDNKFYWFKKRYFDLDGFKLIGTLVALAVHNSMLLPIRFPILLYKKLLNVPLSIIDLYEIKPEVASSLQSILDDDFNASEMNLFFDLTIDNFGVPETIELILNGSQIAVTNENRKQYVDSVIEYELNSSVKEQFEAFKQGFWLVFQIAKNVTIYEPEEFDIIISGQTVYDWEELKKNTTYSDGYTEDSENIRLFWQVFDELSQENKIEFLMFLTGTKMVPIKGLKEIDLEIQRSADAKYLPVAHACSNILQLPDYCDADLLRKNIMICIENNNQFHLI